LTGVDFVNQIIRQSSDSSTSNKNMQNQTKICDAIKHLLDEHQAHGMFSPSAKWEPGLEELLKKTLNEMFLPLANVSLITENQSSNNMNEKENLSLSFNRRIFLCFNSDSSSLTNSANWTDVREPILLRIFFISLSFSYFVSLSIVASSNLLL